MRSRLRWSLAVLAVLAAACGGAEELRAVRIQNRDIDVLPRTPSPDRVNPLTGVVYDSPQEWGDRPALAVKIGNSSAERPQTGLGRADVVYEELTEGGITRLVAIFHSDVPDRVGPVRSARSVDPNILAPIGGLLAYAGGVPPVVAAVRDIPTVLDVGVDRVPTAYDRDDSRDAPYNLYVSTAPLFRGRTGSPPPPLFDFLLTGARITTGGDAATSVSFAFAGNSSRVAWRYDGTSQTYSRSVGERAHDVEGGGQIRATNVIVQFVNVGAGTIVDRAGSPSPESDVLSGGRALVLRGGRLIEGRWTRAGRSSVTKFVDASGDPIELARGRTWIELLPSGRDVSTS